MPRRYQCFPLPDHREFTKQSTENLLVNAANVDPFLEGRRPRHLWSHQLRLRTTPSPVSQASPAVSTSKETPSAGDQQRRVENSGLEPHGGPAIQTSNSASCLGPAGERALFESLSAGAKGAFVAWVKGGHETRQECKRLVTDVLDLLAAPRGQTEAFFQRGTQRKHGPGGRVGIAAKKTWATPAEARTPSLLRRSHVLGSVNEPENAENSVDVDGAEGGTLGGAPGVPRRHPPDTKGQRDLSTAGHDDAGSGDGDQGPVLKHSYASLRKIRDKEPLPKVRKENVGLWSRRTVGG